MTAAMTLVPRACARSTLTTPPPLSWVLAHAARLARAWRCQMAMRRRRQAAFALDDRVLADIGVTRHELHLSHDD